MPDAKLELRNLLINNWDPAATDYDGTPAIHTGVYDRDGDIPCVALSAKDEGPEAGGTGYSAMAGGGAGGGGVQEISGAITVDCVAGTYGDLESAGTNGSQVNPKKLAEQMYQHVSGLVVQHYQTTALQYMAPGDADELVESVGTDNGPIHVFRTQLRVRYGYTRRP